MKVIKEFYATEMSYIQFLKHLVSVRFTLTVSLSALCESTRERCNGRKETHANQKTNRQDIRPM